MKPKHNKKRNTAFLYEVLIRELTKSVVRRDHEKKKNIILILKEHFGVNSILYKELQLYRDIFEKIAICMALNFSAQFTKNHKKFTFNFIIHFQFHSHL